MNSVVPNFILSAFAIIATLATFLSGILYVGTERRKTRMAQSTGSFQNESLQVQTAGSLTQEAISLVTIMREDLNAARQEIQRQVTRIRHLEQQNQELMESVAAISQQLIEMKESNLQLKTALTVALQLRYDTKLIAPPDPSVT